MTPGCAHPVDPEAWLIQAPSATREQQVPIIDAIFRYPWAEGEERRYLRAEGSVGAG